MEDILSVYTRAYDPTRPQICFDETLKQLVAHAREPLPATSGHPPREDYECERQCVWIDLVDR